MKYLLITILVYSMADGRSGLYPEVSRMWNFASWDSTKNWKLYKIQNLNEVVHISVDSLKFLTNVALNDDSMHFYLSGSKPLPPTNPAWMGCYLASFEGPDGQVRKVIISHYAGFFYYQSEKSYFEIKPDEQQAWLHFISESYITIH